LAASRLRNDLYCVEWGVKLYTLTHPFGGVGVRPDERTLKQRTRWTGVSSSFTEVGFFTCDRRWAAGAEQLTVNMHDVHNFTFVMSELFIA